VLHSLKALNRFQVRAADGEIGQVRDGYFDDERWVVRYLVVATGGWLSGRDVLISPYSIRGIGTDDDRAVITRLTRKQVEGSPSIDTHQPISRRHEAAYLGYYGYPLYWPYATFWAWGAMPTVPAPIPPVPESPDLRVLERAASDEDVHLRSAREVTGYNIQGSDEPVGHVDDFLFEDQTWALRYVVADTRNWLPGKRVLIATQWIRGVSWPEHTVDVDLTRAAIEASPPFDPDHLPSRDDEAELHRHYRREAYWGSSQAPR